MQAGGTSVNLDDRLRLEILGADNLLLFSRPQLRHTPYPTVAIRCGLREKLSKKTSPRREGTALLVEATDDCPVRLLLEALAKISALMK